MLTRRSVTSGLAALGATLAVSPGAICSAEWIADGNGYLWSDWRNLVFAPDEYAEWWGVVRDVIFSGRPEVIAAAQAIEAELAPPGDVGDLADAAWQEWQALPSCQRSAAIVRSMAALDMRELILSDGHAGDVLKVFAGVAREMAARVLSGGGENFHAERGKLGCESRLNVSALVDRAARASDGDVIAVEQAAKVGAADRQEPCGEIDRAASGASEPVTSPGAAKLGRGEAEMSADNGEHDRELLALG